MHLFAVEFDVTFDTMLENEQLPVKHYRLGAFSFEKRHTIILPDDADKIKSKKGDTD